MAKEKNRSKTLVLSVSLEKGCYRHLKVSDAITLEELADGIIWAFDFDNDHAHAFFMDNRAWSDADCYYMDFGDDEDEDGFRHTCDFTLANVNLAVGQKFVFVFDFGDDWRFQCKVLKILDEAQEEIEIIRGVGEAPAQYGSF